MPSEGIIYKGITEIEFLFPLETGEDYHYLESYHGLILNASYSLSCEIHPKHSTKIFKNKTDVLIQTVV